MDKPYYTHNQPSWLMRQFWKIAGADRYILEKSTYTDQIKYTCIGGIILATGFMAALAGGYAFYTIFSPKGDSLNKINTSHYQVYYDTSTTILSTIFGVAWGLIIFNIDRFIVTSTGKGDGTEAITKQELKGALPRIIMGIIIALTISKPIEIRMFQSEINTKLHEIQITQKANYLQSVEAIYLKKDIDLTKQGSQIKSTIDALNFTIKTNDSLFNSQVEGRGKATSGLGPLAKLYQNKVNSAKAELKVFRSENKNKIDNLEERSKKLLEEKLKQESDGDKIADGFDGLLERIKISDELAPGITIFITLLFMSIELTPIFFKLMLVKGPYDFLEENIKDLVKAQNGIEVRHDFYKDAKGLERDLVINHEVEKIISMKANLSTAQQEINEYIIQKWKTTQLEHIDANLDQYISEVNK